MKNTTSSDSENNYQRKVLLAQRIGAVTVCLILAGVFAYFYFTYGKQIYDIFATEENMRAFLSQFKGFDKLVFVAIRAFQTVIKIIPAEPLEIGSGILYGTWGGLGLCMLGTFLGSLAIIGLTKVFGKKLVSVFIPLEKIESLGFFKNEKRVYTTFFFIYLIPGTPKDVFTYAASLVNLDMKKFLFVTGIARIPAILTSTWCGQEILNKNYTLAIIIFVVTAALGVICSLIYNKITKAKEEKAKLKEAQENEENFEKENGCD